MSEFADIDTAYDAWEAAGRDWGAVTYGLIYTCNAGWLDLGHLNPESDRRQIGARNLWDQVRTQGPDHVRHECSLESADLNVGYTVLRQWLYGCGKDPLSRFPDGSTGFTVRYRQDHAGYPGRPGVGGVFLVRKGLTEAQGKSVALSIFMDISHAFESFQSWIPDRITDSGYSQEDLVSNLIGFHIAVGTVSKREALRLAHPVDRETAKAVWIAHGSVGSNPNETFDPVLRDTYRIDDADRMCTDACVGQPRQFPSQFRSVRPAPEGADWRKLSSDALLSVD